MKSLGRILVLRAAPIAVILAWLPAQAAAQYRPLPSTYGSGSDVKGETYRIEFATNIWNPPPEFLFKSEGLGIPGTAIDLGADLGIGQKPTYELRLVLRTAKKHKFRFHYLPMEYSGDATLRGDIIFNGIRFPVAVPVQTAFVWKAYRITYEWDVLYRTRWFAGVLLEAKYADAMLELTSPVGREFVKARAPIPAIGAVVRGYPLKALSIHGEFTYFRLPDNLDADASLAATDIDVYATYNITRNFGVQGGWRSTDMGFRIEMDEGSMKLQALYVGGVVRY